MARQCDGRAKPPWGTPLDFSHPLADGLILAWALNEGSSTSGIVTDVSGCNRNGSLSTGGGSGTTWRPGAPGLGPAFYTGQSGNVFLTTPPALAAYTAVLGLRSNVAPSATTSQPLRGAVTSDSWGFSWGHVTVGFRQAAYHQNSAGVYSAAKLTSTLAANVDYQLASGWDGADKLYCALNGVIEATTTGVASLKTPSGTFKLTGVVTHQFELQYFFLYGRWVGAQQVAELAWAPWSMFRSAGLLRSYTGGGGASSVPVFYTHLVTQGMA